MRDMAEELLKLYAQRKAVPGLAFSPDTHWQEEFEDAFPYELTADQATAIADIKRDMETPTPMDRLLCGDVGYGKTEVAMRAAFKAVMDGKQVAVLAPTTVLAEQHQQTLRERFAGFPVTIDMLSRFRTKQEIKDDSRRLAAGKVDIVIGTHRLLSKDVEFKDLGLLVIDEEQRFGVEHKERLKQMRKKVDVLTMTATPIPRTLHMSLLGIRDMSNIETPPKDRLSIQTNVVKFDAPVIERAIRNEAGSRRPGLLRPQPRRSIFSIGSLLQRLVPEARIVDRPRPDGRGRARDARCSGSSSAGSTSCWRRRSSRTASTFPTPTRSSSTGPTGTGCRSCTSCAAASADPIAPAYAYLLIPPQESLSPVARKRLAAIKEFSDLGSGFRVAALDLEIRGAGNLLGGEQSGHIDAVGFEMYMKLLEETVRELKGEEIEDDIRATVNLRVDLKIDEGYIPDMNQRLMVYRKVAAARSEKELGIDPRRDARPLRRAARSVLNLAEYGRIRVLADRLGVETIDREGRLVVISSGRRPRSTRCGSIKVVHEWPGATLVPPVSLKLDLEATPRGSLKVAGYQAARIGPRANQASVAGGLQASGARLVRTQLVDGAGDDRRGDGRVHQGGDSAEARGRTRAPKGACSPAWKSCLQGLGCKILILKELSMMKQLTQRSSPFVAAGGLGSPRLGPRSSSRCSSRSTATSSPRPSSSSGRLPSLRTRPELGECHP